jgi:hypothetical protein
MFSKTHNHPNTMHQALQGRVYARQQRFTTLPVELQHITKQFEDHVKNNKSSLFQTHHHALVKSVYSVKGKDLIDAVIQWIHMRDVKPTSHHAANPLAAHHAPTAGSHHGAHTTATSQVYEHARQIAEALVLSGFLTPYKDDEKHLNTTDPDHFVTDSELLVPVAQGVAESTTPSVWSVAPIASYTAFLKRKSGMLEKLKGGKDVYIMISNSTQRAYLFKSDVSHEPLGVIAGNSVSVHLDNSLFTHGVRIELNDQAAGAHASVASAVTDNSTGPTSLTKKLSKGKPELFDAGSAEAQNALSSAWLHIGAEYRKPSLTGAHGSLGATPAAPVY